MNINKIETALRPVVEHVHALRALDGLVAGPHMRPNDDLSFVTPEDLALLLRVLSASLSSACDAARQSLTIASD